MKFRKKCSISVYFIFTEYTSNKKSWSYLVSSDLVELLELGDITDLERMYVDVILVSGEKLEVKFLKFLTDKRAKIVDYMLRTVNNSKKGIDAMIFSTLTAKYSNQKQEFIFPFTLCLNGLYISVDEIKAGDSMAKVASEIVNEFKQNYDDDEKEIDPDIARLGLLVQTMQEDTNKKYLQTIEAMHKDVANVKEAMRKDVANVKEAMQKDVAGFKEKVVELKEDVADVKEDVADVKEEVADVKEEVAGLKAEIKGLREFLEKMLKK